MVNLDCNPKMFFTYSMAFFTNTIFIGRWIQGFSSFPLKSAFKISFPILYSKSQTTQTTSVNNDKEMEKIVNELKLLKVKEIVTNYRKRTA